MGAKGLTPEVALKSDASRMSVTTKPEGLTPEVLLLNAETGAGRLPSGQPIGRNQGDKYG